MKIIITYSEWTDENIEIEKLIAVEYSSIEALKADMIADNLSYHAASTEHHKKCSEYKDAKFRNETSIYCEERNIKKLTKSLVDITAPPIEERPEHYYSIVSSLSEKIKSATKRKEKFHHTKFGPDPIMNRPTKKFNLDCWYHTDLHGLRFYTLDEWFFNNQVKFN